MTAKISLQRLVLFDAHAVLHRAYHALPNFISSRGESTGGLYGLAAMLIRIINELKPDHIAACYDIPEPTFRKQIYEAYKAGRPKVPDELVGQMERSRDIFKVFNIPIYEYPGFEADDIIGTICRQVEADQNLQVIIASGDMDTLQLVNDDRVVVYTLRKGLTDTILYNEKKVIERFGFRPEFLADFKGLRGDPSDNIIGVPGIGEKTATILIKKFGRIEDLYAKAKKDKSALTKAGLSSRLEKIILDNEEEAFFSKILATIRTDAPIKFVRADKNWRDTLDLQAIEKLFVELDFRTLGARVKNIFNQPTQSQNQNQKTKAENPLLSEIKKVGIALWLVDSNKTNPTLEDIYQFAGVRDFTKAKKKILAELKKRKLEKIFTEIELPIMPIIDQAVKRGILIDKKYLKILSAEYHQETINLEKKIFQQVGVEFNINSPKQLGEVLFDRLNLQIKGLKKTAGGARSTRQSELEKLKNEHAVIKLILDYRELQKILSTYINNLLDKLDVNDRLHTNLNQAGTTTGRMSSTDPNLQNIPVGDGLATAVRRAFIASPGHVWIGADYSQIEMRVLAALAKDQRLIRIFKEGKDVHNSVASLVFGVAENKVTKDMRRRAKVINFGIIYGMGVNALRANLGGTREAAQKFYDDYFKTFPRIKHYFDEVISAAYAKGYTTTLFGRRRYFPGLKSHLPYIRSASERQAMNAPVQGTATADIIKIAIRKVDEELKKAGLTDRCHFLLPIHDELIYEIEVKKQNQAAAIIKQTMEQAVDIGVPLLVNLAAGKNWAELG